MSDRGRDVSAALTEVRTVLSRAENALSHRSYFEGDPDGEEMKDDLRYVVMALERWKRTGKARKAECPVCGHTKTVLHNGRGLIEPHRNVHVDVSGARTFEDCPGVLPRV